MRTPLSWEEKEDKRMGRETIWSLGQYTCPPFEALDPTGNSHNSWGVIVPRPRQITSRDSPLFISNIRSGWNIPDSQTIGGSKNVCRLYYMNWMMFTHEYFKNFKVCSERIIKLTKINQFFPKYTVIINLLCLQIDGNFIDEMLAVHHSAFVFSLVCLFRSSHPQFCISHITCTDNFYISYPRRIRMYPVDPNHRHPLHVGGTCVICGKPDAGEHNCGRCIAWFKREGFHCRVDVSPGIEGSRDRRGCACN